MVLNVCLLCGVALVCNIDVGVVSVDDSVVVCSFVVVSVVVGGLVVVSVVVGVFVVGVVGVNVVV